MRKILFQLLVILTLVLVTSSLFGQISNTSTTITLQNNPAGVDQQICSWNQSIPSGGYTVQVTYGSQDFATYGQIITTAQVTCTVTNNFNTTGQIIINAPALTLPTDLVLTQGHIDITGGGLTGTWTQGWQFEQFQCFPLPLFITDFYVDNNYSSSNYFKINWQTMEEHNTSHFIIQQSTDGRHFSDALMEPAAGESTNTINYVAYINGTGYNWFRLKAIDLDGYYQYSWIKWPSQARSGASNFCSFTYMEGPDKICGSSAIFKLHNVPVGNVNWSLSAYGNITTSNAGLIATINRTGVGNATLTASPSAGCSQSKSLLLGSPLISGTYFSNGQEHPLAYWNGEGLYNDVCNLQNLNTNMQIYGATSVSWSKIISSPSNISWSQNGNNLSFYFWSIGQTSVFRITATNGCGNTTNDFGFKSIDCSGGGGGCYQYQVSPNPARSSMKVAVPQIIPPCDLAATQSKKSQNLSISEIRIYDLQGFLKTKQKFEKVKVAQVNLSNYKTGIYIVEITDGQYTERQQLIIQN